MADTRVKNSARNMVFGFTYQLVVLILSFVSRSVFINTLGKEFLGMNAIFSDVLSLLSMADLGFGTAMAFSFYKPLAENDHEMIAKTINFYKKIYNIIALAVLVLGLACIPFLKYIINTDKDIPNLEIYYLFSLAGVVVSYLMVYKTTLLTADQKDYKVVNIRMWTQVLKTVLQIVVLLIARNYILYLAIGVIVQLVNNVIASRVTDKEYPYIKDKQYEGKVSKEFSKNMFQNIFGVFIYKVSNTLYSATDNIIMSIVAGTVLTGLYSNYYMVSCKLLLVEQIVFSALTASVGNVVAKESAEKKYSIFKSMQSASFIFCGIITSGFCVMINDLVGIWLGADFVFDNITVIAITINTYFSCVLTPLWIYRDATGLYRRTKYIMLVGAILNIILSFVLGNIMGIAGVIFASAIARISTYFWYEPRVLFKEYFNKQPLEYYVSMGLNFLLVAGTIAALSFLTKGIVVDGVIMFVVKSAIVGVACCIVFVLAYCRTDGFQLIANKAKSIINKRKKKM